MTLYVRQQKRHRDKAQTFVLCGRRLGWDDLREQHWNMYITICEIDRQSRFNAWDRALRAGALGRPWGMGLGGRWEGGSGWGTHVHPCAIHVNWAPKSLQMVIAAMKLKDAYFLEEKLWPTYIAYWKAETLHCLQRSVYSRLWFFQWSCMDVRVGLWRKLSTKELMLLNCGVGEDSCESLGLQGDPTGPF